MPDILSTDILFLASERMTQNDDGGGRITADVVLDNEENGLFPDIASGDRIAGRTWLALIFGAVRSPNAALYLASRVFLTEPPLDPNVSVALFTTGSWTASRKQLADYVEAYVTPGPASEIKLLGDHVAGQQLIFCYQRPGADLPEIGEVFVLSEETAGGVLGSEYVRITKIEHELVTWVDPNGEFIARRMELTLSDPLTRRYPGGVPNRYSSYVPPTLIRVTSPADAARFKGISPLTAAAAIGDSLINVGSIYTRVVPSTQSETPLIDVQAGGNITMPVSGGTRSVEFPVVAHTERTLVTISNRQLNYTMLTIPKPEPGTLLISYRALGKWYTLQDTDQDGSLTGAGVGTVNYATGSLSITLTAIPDVNSSILWAWGSPVHFESPNLTQQAVQFKGWTIQLAHEGIELSSVVVNWESGGATKTAIADDKGILSGDGAGKVNAKGKFSLMPAALPDPGATPTVTYRFAAVTTEHLPATKDEIGIVTVTTSRPITPGTLTAKWRTRRTKTESELTRRTGAGA